MHVLRDIKEILRGNVLILFITWVLLSFGGNMVHRFDGIYFSALGASDELLGYMGALTFGMMALLQLPGGYFADVLGRKRLIVTFTFVMAFSMLIFAFAPSWEYIVVGLIISNASLLYQPALFSIIMDSLPKHRRAEGFAVINLSSLPALIAPVVGGYIIFTLGVVSGMRIGYLILFFLSLTAAFMRMFLKETVSKNNGERSFLSIASILKNLNFRAKWIIIIGSLISSAGGMVGYFIIKYSYNYTNAFNFGLAMGISMLISIVSGVYIGRYGDRKGKEKLYVAGMLLSSLGIIIFIVPSLAYLFLYAVISGLGMAFYQPMNQGLIADLVGLESRGRFTGVFLFISYISAMLFSGISGYIYSFSPAILFLFSGILYLIAALIALKIFVLNIPLHKEVAI